MATRNLSERLGARARNLRRHLDLTQEQVAERAGVAPNYISAIERGAKVPTLDTLARIAEALEVSLSELLLDVDRLLPREVRRLETALAARQPDVQRAVLDVVSATLRAVDLSTRKKGR